MMTIHSVLLYGTDIWADVLSSQKYRNRIAAVKPNGALSVPCAYRTVSRETVPVIADVTPKEFVPRERKQIDETA